MAIAPSVTVVNIQVNAINKLRPDIEDMSGLFYDLVVVMRYLRWVVLDSMFVCLE